MSTTDDLSSVFTCWESEQELNSESIAADQCSVIWLVYQNTEQEQLKIGLIHQVNTDERSSVVLKPV